MGWLGLLVALIDEIKLVLPIEAMAGPVALPGLFLRFIGVAEVLGAAGLILPWLLKIRPELTALAAAGLVVIMVGATAVTLTAGMPGAVVPFLTGLLASVVAYGRSKPSTGHFQPVASAA